MTYALTADDLNTAEGLTKFQALCETYNACEDSGGYRSNALAESWTFQQFISRVSDYFPDDGPKWAAWCRQVMSPDMAPEVRVEFSREAAAIPQLAVDLDINLTDASAAERLMLRSVWHSAYNGGNVLFPTIEEEAETGVIALPPIDGE